MRNMQREKAQADVIKSANASHLDYPRYASFGADYVFAVPKSFAVDELSAPGVQLLMPGGNIKANKLEDLYGSGVAAVQPIAAAQAKPNDNASLKNYVNNTVVPDLKKNVGSDVTTVFSIRGKYQMAEVTVKKDGQDVRWLHIYGGAHPYTLVAKTRNDAFIQVADTLISTPDAAAKDDV